MTARRVIERLTGVPTRNGYAWLYPYIFISFVVMALAVGVLLQSIARKPTVYYTDLAYAPQTICPGDALEYSVIAHVSKGPEVLMLVRTWWSVDRHQTTIFDMQPEYTVVMGEEGGVVRNFAITVPAMPAGRYEHRVGSAPAQAAVAAYGVPFTIPTGCP